MGKCNLNQNELGNDDNENDFIEEEDEGNFVSYFLGDINYKIIKCYHLLYINNLIKTYAFYFLFAIFGIIIIFTLSFFISKMKKLRILMYEKLPTESKLRKYMIKQLQKIRKNRIFIPSKMDNKKNENKIIKNNKGNKRKNNTHKNNKRKFTIDTIEIYHRKKDESNNNSNKYLFNNGTLNNQNGKIFSKKNNIYEENIININVKEYNKYPFTKALREDKRNIFQIFMSLVFEKIDFLSI